MPNRTLDYGDLRVTLTSAYDWRWNDRGSGAARDGGFWHPQAQDDLRPLGSIAVGDHNDRNGQWAVLLVGDNPSQRQPGKGAAVQSPVDYELLWTDRGSGAAEDGSFWRPVPPTGYISLGDVANAGHGKPDLDQVWCLRTDLVAAAAYEKSAVWDDKGSASASDASFWRILPVSSNSMSQYIPVPAGTFRVNSGYSTPDGSLARVPALYVPKTAKPFSPRPPVVTADEIPDIGMTFNEMSQSSVTLPFTSFFDPSDKSGLKGIADPFCSATKLVSWYVSDKFPNYQSTPITQQQEAKVGHTTRVTDETTNSVGVTVSTEAGYGLAKFSISLNYQFTLSHSSSVEETQERTMTKTLTVAPHSVAIAWAKQVVVRGTREDGSPIGEEIKFIANEEVAITEVKVPADN